MRSFERVRRLVGRVRTLDRHEQALAAIAALALPLAAISIRTLGIRRICGLIEAIAVRRAPLARPAAKRVVDVVGRVATASGLPVACLERSLVSCVVLRQLGYDATLCVGVLTKPQFSAHAWIEIAGVAIGEPDETRTFTTLLRVGSPR